MAKAFLSHSSRDKAFVERVFGFLKAAHANYDSRTFDSFKSSHATIVSALQDSDIFVAFVSEQSLNSEWVKEEVQLAVDKAAAGKIMPRAVVLLEGLDRDLLPPALQAMTAIRYADPDLVARKILGMLQDIAATRKSESNFFIGRDEDLTKLKEALLPVTSPPPTVIFISGTSGMGKKTLLSRGLQDCFPFLPRNLRIIPITEGMGPFDVFMRLFDSSQITTLSELSAAYTRVGKADVSNQIRELGALINSIAESRDVVVFDGAQNFISDEGDFASWVWSLMAELRPAGFPSIAFISTRQLAPKYRVRPLFHSQSIFSISSPNSTRLLSSLLSSRETKLSAGVQDRLVTLVDGHPGQIQMAAKLIATDGGLSAELRASEVADAIAHSGVELIRLLRLDSNQFALLGLFREFGLMTSEDIILAIDGKEAGESLSALVDSCVIEKVGGFYRVAPYLEVPIRRAAAGNTNTDLLLSARLRIAERLQHIESSDLVEFSALDQSVVAWLRSGREAPPVPGAKMLLPASLLRAAGSAYHEQEYQLSANLSERAIAGEWTLTPQALGEAYRLRGLSLARLEESQPFEEVIHEIESSGQLRDAGLRFPQQLVRFLRGFNCRLNGQYTEALKHFEEFIKNGGERHSNALREFADVQLKMGNVPEAEAASRRAMSAAPHNPYVIALLYDSLTAALAIDPARSGLISEREELFSALVRADEINGTSFATLRSAKQLMEKRDYVGAVQILDQSEQKGGVDPISLRIARADALLGMKDWSKALRTADEAIVEGIRIHGKRARQFRSDVTRIKVTALCELGRDGEADEELARNRASLGANLQAELRRTIDFAKAHSRR